MQPHNVWVLQLLQDGDLSDRRRGDPLVLSLEPDLLESGQLAGLPVPRLVHDAVRPLPNLLNLLVLFLRAAARGRERCQLL